MRYSLLLGDGGFFAPESIDSLRRNWLRSEENGRFRRLLGPRVEGLLADIEEIERGRGDGAVAIKRGRLDGVADTVVLPFNHLSMLTATETPEAQKLRRGRAGAPARRPGRALTNRPPPQATRARLSIERLGGTLAAQALARQLGLDDPAHPFDVVGVRPVGTVMRPLSNRRSSRGPVRPPRPRSPGAG